MPCVPVSIWFLIRYFVFQAQNRLVWFGLDMDTRLKPCFRIIVIFEFPKLVLRVRIPVDVRIEFFKFLDFRIYVSKFYTKILLVCVRFEQ